MDNERSRASDAEWDALVVGGGGAGMFLAQELVCRGLRVCVVERGSSTGGSARYSGGYVWSARTLSAMERANPMGDPVWRNRIVERFDEIVDRLRELGGRPTGPTSILGIGEGFKTDIEHVLAECSARLERSGGEFRQSERVTELVVEHGDVVGAVTDCGDVLRAAAVVLATGGFQGSASLRARFLGSAAESMPLRASPTSTGDGLLLGEAVDARVTPNMREFYGHLLPYPLAQSALVPQTFRPLSQYYSDHCILLNASGQRFADESFGDHFNSQLVLHEAGGRCVGFFDADTYRHHVVGPLHPGEELIDRFSLAGQAGGNVATCQSLEEVAEVMQAWGYAGPEAVQTIITYVDRLLSGRVPEPARNRNRHATLIPPYRLVELQSAITFTLGGLSVNDEGRILRGDGLPIKGLFACGADVGGIYRGGYAGGLALAFVTALIVSETIGAEREASNDAIVTDGEGPGEAQGNLAGFARVSGRPTSRPSS